MEHHTVQFLTSSHTQCQCLWCKSSIVTAKYFVVHVTKWPILPTNDSIGTYSQRQQPTTNQWAMNDARCDTFWESIYGHIWTECQISYTPHLTLMTALGTRGLSVRYPTLLTSPSWLHLEQVDWVSDILHSSPHPHDCTWNKGTGCQISYTPHLTLMTALGTSGLPVNHWWLQSVTKLKEIEHLWCKNVNN